MRLHSVEFRDSVQYAGRHSKRFTDMDVKLTFDENARVLHLEPYPNHVATNKTNVRTFPLESCFWIEAMSEDAERAANERDELREQKYNAEQERQKALRAAPPPRQPVTDIERLEAQLAAAKAQQRKVQDEPVLTRAPSVRTQGGADAVKIVKDPKTGKLVEVRADGASSEFVPEPAQEDPQAELERLRAELAALQAPAAPAPVADPLDAIDSAKSEDDQ